MAQRPEGNITAETRFLCKLNEDMEAIICDAISLGKYGRVRWGSSEFVKDWAKGNKHDPTNTSSIRIRRLIRLCPGISKYDIQLITGIEKESLSDLLRELDKMDIFENYEDAPPPPQAIRNTILS
jgi:Ni,Fe-hydrogenase maturation factor